MRTLLCVAVVVLSACASAPAEPDPALQPLAGTWKIHVNGVPQQKGQASQTGGHYANDFHYEFAIDGGKVAVTSVADSDDDYRLTLKGDRREVGWFKVDGRRIRGKWHRQDMNGAFSEDFRELTLRWTDPSLYVDMENGIHLVHTEVMRHLP